MIDLFGTDHAAREAMGSHQSASGGSDEWLTPPDLLAAVGAFDLDPCAPVNRPWDTAAAHYTIQDDGLRQPWTGRVWLNPPYANAGKWLARLAEHGTGTAILFARTETRLWFDDVWPKATGLLFLRGRVRFHAVTGKPGVWTGGAPSVLVAYGHDDAQVLASNPWPGHYVTLRGGEAS